MNDTQIEDMSGLAAIQDAMNEIEKLNSNEPEQDENNLNDKQFEKEEESSQNEEENEVKSSSEEDSEDFAEDTVSEPKKPKEKKFWKERKEKYKALAERDRLAYELEELKKQHDKALEVGNYHYGQNAYADLDRAKLQKRRAIEEGDVDALTEADIALVRAANAIDEIERWNSQDRASNTAPTQSNHEYVSTAQQEMARDWIDSNPELNPNSNKYNAALATKVSAYINALDRNIASSNQPEYYFSEDYFDVIDNHIAKLKRPSQKGQVAPASVDNVGGVKKSYQTTGSSQHKNNQKIVLTSVEKTMAANAGLSEEDWLKFKIADLNKTQKRA